MQKMNPNPSQPEKFDLASASITDEQQAKLKALFPEIFTEGGKVDFERLKLTLGGTVDTGKERYGMNWPGKADCFKTIQRPSMATLVPARSESVNFDTTENLIIEGDNLEVLKLLQKSYLGRVKMIYIDPPYNTGNDFIYPDNFSESLETYLRYTGQVDAEGRKFSTNSETDGRFHSKWMNMMYPRLFLARNLLQENGFIFISIDEHEADNLKRICNEVFGEENFMASLIWKRRKQVDSRTKTGISVDHEYCVVYRKNEQSALLGKEIDLTKYKNPNNDPQGPWASDNLVGLATREQRPNLHYDLVNPSTGITYACPPTGWRYSPDSMSKLITEGRILWPESPTGRPRYKRYLSDLTDNFTGLSSILKTAFSADGTNELKTIFGGQDVLDFPKPTEYIKLLVQQGTENDKGDLVLDFFAGSGTTAQAVLELNQQDGGNRKFILVQLPEPTVLKEFKTIADITKERVRRVITNKNEGDAGKLALESGAKPDLGFKVLKLQSSNFKAWNADLPKDAEKLGDQMEMHIDHIEAGRTAEDILFELLLKSGFPLSTRIETLTLAGKTVYSIAEGAMLICLDKELNDAVIKEIAARKPERVVCLDAGFAGNDQLKTNTVQTFKSKGVTSFRTV